MENDDKNMLTPFKKIKIQINLLFFSKSISYWIKILGIILLSLGIFLFWIPLGVNFKIGLIFVIIAIFMLFFITEKSIHNKNDNKIFIFLLIWVLIMFFITGESNIETFFFSIVLGMIICMELTNNYLTIQMKNRLFILTLYFFICCIIVVVEKVISFFHI